MADIQISKNIVYDISAIQPLIDLAIQQEQAYFHTLQESGYILDNQNNISYTVKFTPRRLKQGLSRFLSKKYGGEVSKFFNKDDTVSNTRLNTENISINKIKAFQDVLIQDVKFALLSDDNKTELERAIKQIIQASLQEYKAGHEGASVGFLRELMTLDVIINAARKSDHEIINLRSGSNSWSEGLHYDFQVELAYNNPVEENGKIVDSGIVRGEVKSRLESFKITGFDIKTVINKEYKKIDKALQDEIRYMDLNEGNFYTPGYFNDQLSLAVLRWKLDGYFPFYFKMGQDGGGREILLCSEMLQSLAKGAHLSGTMTFSNNSWFSRLQISEEDQMWEFKNINKSDLQKAEKDARDIIRKRLTRYELWYHK